MDRNSGLLKNYSKPQRLLYPEDEKETDWLSALLDAYYTADKGIFEKILEQEKKGRRLACAKGCSTCCSTHVTIPVYPMELLGIYWYVILKADPEIKESLKIKLENFKPGDSCPFLLKGGACGIHPMRPLACRHFNVFGKSCAPGEDPFYTRRKDVLTPDEKVKNKALSYMVSIHGITDRKERKEFVKSGQIHQLAKNIQEIDWKKLSRRI
jgi:Fe-S-cluster containining protein